MQNFMMYLTLWGVLAMMVVALAVYRKTLSSKEDDTLHLGSGDGTVVQQASLARQLEMVDKWGKILTFVAAILGVALAGMYIWNVWNDQARMMQ
jgi:hypothetical protein